MNDMMEDTKALVQARDVEQPQEISSLQSCITNCCCLAVKPRDTANDWMIGVDTTGDPSWFQKLCFCQWSPIQRVPSDIGKVPQLKGLEGITMQYGQHETGGSIQTLHWGEFNAEARTMEMAVFGSFGQKYATSQWTEPTTPAWRSALWCVLMNLGRVAGYTYKFEFSEDYRRADIKIKGNPLVLCCICIPCIPPWCTIPSICSEQYMKQADGVSDGTHWERYSGSCGREAEFYYDLLQVWRPDGTQVRANQAKLLEKVSQQVMVSV